MVLEEVEKFKFAQVNDKRCYFSDVIVSLPFSHSLLSEIVEFNERKKERIEKYRTEEKQNLLNMEKKAVLKNHRLSLLRNILLQKPTYYQLDSLKRRFENNENINFTQSMRSYILNG